MLNMILKSKQEFLGIDSCHLAASGCWRICYIYHKPVVRKGERRKISLRYILFCVFVGASGCKVQGDCQGKGNL